MDIILLVQIFYKFLRFLLLVLEQHFSFVSFLYLVSFFLMSDHLLILDVLVQFFLKIFKEGIETLKVFFFLFRFKFFQIVSLFLHFPGQIVSFLSRHFIIKYLIMSFDHICFEILVFFCSFNLFFNRESVQFQVIQFVNLFILITFGKIFRFFGIFSLNISRKRFPATSSFSHTADFFCVDLDFRCLLDMQGSYIDVLKFFIEIFQLVLKCFYEPVKYFFH